MRTRSVVVATLVLLAGASSALAATPNAHTASTVDAGAVAAQDGETYEYQNLTIERLQLTNVSAEQVLVNQTSTTGGNGTSYGTATATNLTVINATLENVTLEDVTIRNQTVAQQLFGGETPPEGDNATIESATLSEVSVNALSIESASITTVQISDVRTAISPGGAADVSLPEEAAVEIGNMTVESANLSSIEADSVSVENAPLDVLGGGLGGETTANETETGALRAPTR